MNILGFGKAGSKKYKVKEDMPDGWPDSLSFELFLHPSKARFGECNEIIESLLSYHNYDIESHHCEEQ